MPTFACVLGSVTPPGRLRGALSAALEATGKTFPRWTTDFIDLAEHKLSFADGRPLDQLGDDTEAVVNRIIAADALILATPVYRATYTGALKNLLDLTPIHGFLAKPCGIVAMGATDHHYLGVDSQLRAVLTWFGARVAPNSVYLTSRDFTDGLISPEAHTDIMELMRTVVTLQIELRDVAHGLGPLPLAARRG